MSRTRSRTGSTVFVILFICLGIGLLAFQHHYLKSHLPLLKAELAAAESTGTRLLEEIGIPPNAQLVDPIEHRVITAGPDDKWSGTETGTRWLALYDAPGTHAQIDAWYKEHLPKVGWTLRVPRIPSEVQTEFYRDKWLLTIEHDTWFNGREPHAQFRLRLEWDYQHDLAPSRWDLF